MPCHTQSRDVQSRILTSARVHAGWRSYGPAQHASGSTPLTAVGDQIERGTAVCRVFCVLAAPSAARPNVYASRDDTEQGSRPVSTNG